MEGRPAPPGRRRGEDEGGHVCARGVFNRDVEAGPLPPSRQAVNQLGAVLREGHDRRKSIVVRLVPPRVLLSAAVATVEQKGQALSPEQLRDFLREMVLIRRVEEKVEERFRAGELPGFLHVAIGQEAVAVGVCRALEDGDVVASTHRAHAHALAKGMHPKELMAELYGKVEGCSHGYGGSMHLYDVERGFLGANAVVGGGIPSIVGAALAFKMRGEPRVAVAFFGDGATNIGTYHESLNLAQLWRVPAIFVCETARLTGHYVGDPQVYRAKEEVRDLRETQDPIEKLRARLELGDEEWEEIDAEATRIADGSVDFAKAGTDPKPEDALKNVYA